jgi:RNA recognition motif-containing protein
VKPNIFIFSDAFAPYGTVEAVKILRHKQCAFVRFDSIETAGAAFSAMNGGYVHGQQIKIGWGKVRDGQSYWCSYFVLL